MGKYYKFLGDFGVIPDGVYGGLEIGKIYDCDDIIPLAPEKSDRRDDTIKYYVNKYPSDWEEVPSFEQAVWGVLHDVGNMLVEKNKKYGNSALAPSNIFSKLSALDSLKVRIDDKLSRIRNGSLDEDEDVTKDLIGYLILYRIEKYGKDNS